MKDVRLVGSSLALAIPLAGIASGLAESPAVLGIISVGIAIYLVVGVGLPQYLLSRRSGSRLQPGLAGLAIGSGSVAVIVGVATGSPNAERSTGLVAILLVVVLGTALGATLREFRAGYRSRS